MAKLYFHYSSMNAGKSTILLQAAYNYQERGMEVFLLTAGFDTRAGSGRIASRIGIGAEAATFGPDTDLFDTIRNRLAAGPCACVFLDEAQFLTREQVEQALAIAVLDDVPVLAYGIRTDFRTAGFPGSTRLLEIAHSLEELKTICRCGRKAMFNARKGSSGFIFDGEQVAIDSIDTTYESLCANCYLEERAKA